MGAKGLTGAEITLTALYLRGSPSANGLDRRRWPKVLSSLRRHAPELQHAAECLAEAGHWDEARALVPAALEFAARHVESERTLSVLHEAYPFRWLDALGSSAPPILWRLGPLPTSPALAVVGPRSLEADWKGLAWEVGKRAGLAGHTVVSGGARGTDQVAVQAARTFGGFAVELIPRGIAWAEEEFGTTTLSACEPEAEFSTGQAMERNALIYAWSGKAVAVRPWFKSGGTWHGAVDALRRRTSHVWVADEEDSAAAKALCALGASLLRSADDLPLVLQAEAPAGQPDLFGLGWVREARGSYLEGEALTSGLEEP